MSNEKKNNKGAIAALIAVFLLGGTGFGITKFKDFGAGKGNGQNNNSTVEVAKTSVTTLANNKSDTTEDITVIVNEDTIKIRETDFTIEEFQEYVDNAKSNVSFTIKDDNAIKATFEKVLSILSGKKITYKIRN